MGVTTNTTAAPVAAIAERFRLSPEVVRCIVARRTWRHVS
jgi:hypothetical protein